MNDPASCNEFFVKNSSYGLYVFLAIIAGNFLKTPNKTDK